MVFSVWLPCLETKNPETKIFRILLFDVTDLDTNYSDNTSYTPALFQACVINTYSKTESLMVKVFLQDKLNLVKVYKSFQS